MNKFKNIAKKLINNKLWSSEIEYHTMKKQQTAIGLPETYEEDKIFKMKVVIKKVAKNLVDNEHILNTDFSILMDSFTCIPNINDYIVIDNRKYKIVSISPLGTLDNEPLAFELVLRLA